MISLYQLIQLNFLISFSGLVCDLYKSELVNKSKDPRGHRYSEVKKFALTLHFYSPHAYTFV